MKTPLHILHLEDNLKDAALIEAFLETEGISCDIVCVSRRNEFCAGLEKPDLDLILSDFSMPGFDGLSALDLARKHRPDVPFIFLSGTIGEELAVEALKEGATDYVIKDRMTRLPIAIRRALREREDSKQRRAMEEELRKSEERFKYAARATQDMVWEWDLVRNEVWRSDNYQTLFGKLPGETGTGIESWHQHIHPQDRDRVVTGIRAAIDSGQETWLEEYRFLRADGSPANVFARAYIIRDAKGKAVRIIGATMDITTRKQADERIREQAALLDRAQEAISLNDMSQQILYWNKGAERLYGWTPAEALGKNANDLLFQGDLSAPHEALRHLIRQGEWQGELNQVTKTGKKVIIESRWTLLRDDRNEPKSILVMNADITERKRLEAEYLRTQRVETIGALAGGIAHDLNNTLAPVLMGINLLRKESLSPETARMLDLMDKSALRGSEMVKQILSFSRGVGGHLAVIDVRHLVEEMVRLAEKTFPRSIKILTTLPEDMARVRGNATQLHQVLLNLCVNARDAMPEGGTLTIEAANAALDNKSLPAGRGLNAGAYVILKVSDTGHGIAPELLGRIFEPFFSTKELNRGTGLGLSTTMGIVKTHGGFLDVTSGVGTGSTFKVGLPALPPGAK
ncbi:MAG TPA: PAS domain-containing protein [Verrucomicrobiae bacterium]|nr:PAS domain-containing protein [Verrucomicrobiae bacterium]